MDVARIRLRLTIGAMASALASLAVVSGAQAAFPGANGKIAFTRSISQCGSGKNFQVALCGQHLFTMNPDGSAQTDLESGSSNSDTEAAWSADGTKIAFVRTGAQDQIWIMNADGSGQKQVTNNVSNSSDWPSWSPDGTKIAFQRADPSYLVGNVRIFVINVDGTGETAVSNPTGTIGDVDPAWSPDGSKIAFSRSGNGIWAVNASGGGDKELITSSGSSDDYPNWSPDGTKLAFARDSNTGNDAGNGDIYVQNADGSGTAQNISKTAAHDPERPAYSPDGAKVTFDDYDGKSNQVYVVSSDGSGTPQNVSNDDSLSDSKPDWQPQPNITSVASVPACSANGQIPARVADPSGFKSGPKALHYKVDGGSEQVAPTDSSGNATAGVLNGTHSLEYWGEDQAGYQQPTHNTTQVRVDTVGKCQPPPAPLKLTKPTLHISGVHGGCTRSTFRLTLSAASSGSKPTITVYLDGHKLKRLKGTKMGVRIKAAALRAGRHQLKIVVKGAGGTTTRRAGFTVCKAAVQPRFTG